MNITYNGQNLTNHYKVTRHIPELGMIVATRSNSNKSFKDYVRSVNSPPKGLRKPLSKAVKVEDLHTGEIVEL